MSQKLGLFELIYSASLKRENNSDSQIAVYYHPCNQNTNNHFGPLKQEEIRKLTFVIVSKLFLANRLITLCPLPEFSFIFQQPEDMSKSLKYCLGYILKGQKVLNDRMKLKITKRRRHLKNSALRRDWH